MSRLPHSSTRTHTLVPTTTPSQSKPLGSNFRAAKHAFDSLAACKRHDENGSPLLARTAGPAGTVLQCFSVARNVGVNDEAQIGQINTARCHVRRHAYTRTAVPQSLHGMIALILRSEEHTSELQSLMR